jgi:N6-adenosine-specific RNA methylase IME4
VLELPSGPYSVIYADPPWPYYGDPNKNAAAGKHYKLMSQDELRSMDVRSIAAERSWLFLWATPARLHMATDLMTHWGFHYRNVAYFWRKTKRGGTPVSDRQGIRPTYTKTAWFELLLLGTSKPTGRMTPLGSDAHPSEIFAPREEHSKKPAVFRNLIVEQLGNLPRIELFARSRNAGWDSWGLEVPRE